MRQAVISLAAWLFLAGTVLVALAAVPRFSRRWPKLLLWGFLTAIGSFVLVGVAALFGLR